MRSLIVAILIFIVPILAVDQPKLHRRVLISSGPGYAVCSCYINARCNLAKNRCDTGSGTCERCVYYDADGRKTWVVVACPSDAECKKK